jgi:hypothetical protein
MTLETCDAFAFGSGPDVLREVLDELKLSERKLASALRAIFDVAVAEGERT